MDGGQAASHTKGDNQNSISSAEKSYDKVQSLVNGGQRNLAVPIKATAINFANDSTMEGSSSKKDPKWSDIESMFSIQKSPYESNESAEVGESVFDEIKAMLLPSEGSIDADEMDPHTPSPEASRLFGGTLAESLVIAHQQIGKSGMLYSPAWQEGKIRGIQCGWISKPLLLLCLHEQRFHKAEETVLVGVIKDLGLCKIVKDALKEWDLEREFLNLASCTTYFSFSSRKQACCKCEIFVARAYRCVKVLKRQLVDEGLMAKIKACLRIMDQHAKVNKRDLQKRKASLQDEKPSHKQQQNSSQEHKKQRKISSSNSESTSSCVPPATPHPNKSDGNGNTKDVGSPSQGSSTNDGGDSKLRRLKQRDQAEPLSALIERFEEQYKRMGETLVTLKKRLREQNDSYKKSIREDVRAELLQELILNGYTGAGTINT